MGRPDLRPGDDKWGNAIDRRLRVGQLDTLAVQAREEGLQTFDIRAGGAALAGEVLKP
jgi:hypothetical protein